MFKNVFMFGHCKACRRRLLDLASLDLGASVVSVRRVVEQDAYKQSNIQVQIYAAGTDVKVGRRDRIRVSAEWQADDSNQADVPNRELFRSE